MTVKPAERLNQLPPYLFAAIDAKKKAAMDKGADIISLGVGDPDLPTPVHIIEAGQKALANPANHQYPFGAGLLKFRQAVASWYQSRFRVALDPATEIHALIGSKEGLAHLPLAFLDPGDVALIPEPGYPAYNASVLLAGGRTHFLPLREEDGFLPNLDAVPADVRKSAKLLYLNFPSNPLSVTAPRSFYEKAIEFARRHDVLIVHDAAYSEMYYEEPPMSFLEVPGAKEVGVEFHYCSKTYNMTGWRVDWVCGNAGAVRLLGKLKDNYDSGVFQAIQEAAVAALTGSQDCVAEMRKIYRERRDFWVDGLKKLGWSMVTPPATFYVWARVPRGFTSSQVAERLLEEAHLVCTPGNGFGPSGEGYVRFALSVPLPRLREALERIGKVRW
jgi:LL-diaminopimelate aminotransferase